MVPQDPGGLIAAMGGPAKAAARLDSFLRDLNGGPGATHTDHALLGNEPTLQTPWLYDWMHRPYRTQEAVRRALLTLQPAPDGYPATTTSARSRPGTCSAPSASTRRSPESACWRSTARSFAAPKSAFRTGAGR